MSPSLQEQFEGKIVCLYILRSPMDANRAICAQDFAGQQLVEQIARVVLIGATVRVLLKLCVDSP